MDETDESNNVTLTKNVTSTSIDGLLIDEENEAEDEGKRYLMGKPKVTCTKSCCLSITAVIVVFICIVTVALLLTLREPPCHFAEITKLEPASASINYSQVILMSLPGGIGYLDPKAKNSSISTIVRRAANLFDVYAENSMYWVDESTRAIRFFPEGEHRRLNAIRYPRTWKLTSVATDFASEKLYLIESASNSLLVVDVRTKFHRTLSKDLENSRDLAVDPTSGFLFFAKHATGIFRMNMDGSMSTLIVIGSDISTLAVDCESKLIYYAIDYTSIVSSNYDGASNVLLTEISMKVTSMALLDNGIVWSTDRYLYSCEVSNRRCDNDNLNEVTYLNNTTIIRTRSHRIRAMDNPCESDEASTCEEMCLLTWNRKKARVDFVCSCKDGWQLNVNGRTCEPLSNLEMPSFENVITLLDADGYIRLLKGESFEFLKFLGKENDSNIVFDVSYNNIFWCDQHTSTIKSLTPEFGNVPYPSRWTPIVIRVDYVTDKIYLLDEKTETINCIDMNNKFFMNFLSDMEDPRDFQLDPELGLMFILHLSSKSISRATMSGSSLTTIVSNITTSISSFTIDRLSQTIYCALSSLEIKSFGYQNNDPRRTIQISVSNRVNSLAVLDGSLYWLANSHLSSCKIELEGSCESIHSPYPITSDIVDIRSFGNRGNATKTDCRNNNGKCSQLCIHGPTSKSGEVCGCKIGWELLTDERTCSPIASFMLYTKGNIVRGSLLNERTSFREAILPTRFQVESLRLKDSIDFDYNWMRHDFIFSDDHNIFLINTMSNDDSQRKVINLNRNFHIRGVAYDWATGNLYYIQMSLDNSTEHSLVALPLYQNEQLRKTISSFSREVALHALVVHSKRGYLFLDARHGTREFILRTASDGGALQEIERTYSSKTGHAIAVDCEEDLLYWIEELRPKEMGIRRSNLTSLSSGLDLIEIDQQQRPTSISVCQGDAYVADPHGIWRYDKIFFLNRTRKIPIASTTREVVAGVRVVGRLARLYDEAHPCTIGNGGCQEFCFTVPLESTSLDWRRTTAKCGCQDGKSLYQNRLCGG